jgi:4-aminobutyrate aminotransferase-like enzyme
VNASEDGPKASDESSDGVREDMVQKLLKAFHENQGASAIGAFIGVESHKDRPTDAEREEAHRRYVDELAKRGVSELDDGEQ